jgi:predicted small lipoprotein YifL
VIRALARHRSIRRLSGLALLLLALAPGLAACGKRGPPVAPHPEENTYPRVYPRA